MTSDRARLILNQVGGALQTLQKSGIGFIQGEELDTLYYVIDGERFAIRVNAEGNIEAAKEEQDDE